MLKFAILKRIDIDEDLREYFETAETPMDGYLDYDQNEFYAAVISALKKRLKKGLITRKVKVKDIERNLLKAFADATKNIKQKTIYVK